MDYPRKIKINGLFVPFFSLLWERDNFFFDALFLPRFAAAFAAVFFNERFTVRRWMFGGMKGGLRMAGGKSPDV